MANILLIDDDTALTETLREALEDVGHEIAVASNGIEGLDKFDQMTIDLVVCDVNMPRGNGFFAINYVHRKNPRVPIIAISGDESLLDDIAAYGADKWLVKPFGIRELRGLVDKLLRWPPHGERIDPRPATTP